MDNDDESSWNYLSIRQASSTSPPLTLIQQYKLTSKHDLDTEPYSSREVGSNVDSGSFDDIVLCKKYWQRVLKKVNTWHNSRIIGLLQKWRWTHNVRMILVLQYFKIRDDKEDSPLTSGIDLLSNSDQYRPYSNFTKCEEASRFNVAKRGQTMALKPATIPLQPHCFIDRVAA